MVNVTIPKKWYDEIKSLVKMENEFFYAGFAGEMEVEVDVNEAEFEKISKELGWL